MKDTGGSAFPVNTENTPNSGACWPEQGMTLRDYFAAHAMQGIYACPTIIRYADGTPAPDQITNEMIALIAYEQADAMLAARNA